MLYSPDRVTRINNPTFFVLFFYFPFVNLSIYYRKQRMCQSARHFKIECHF